MGGGLSRETGDHGLQPMIDAAMQRQYSGSPSAFFTGGGVHAFANFEKWEDHSNPTVLEAFEHSINNSFIRIMRDIVLYYQAQSGVETEKLLSDVDDPNREAFCGGSPIRRDAAISAGSGTTTRV